VSSEAAVAYEAGTRELLREARRLGLTWGLRPATVISVDHVRYDGDDEETLTRVVNLLESPLFVAQRVMCIFVPPAGNFVIGSLTDTRILFEARRVAAQSIPNASETEIEWDTIDVDTHGGWAAGFETDWTAPFAGWYHLTGGCGWASGGTGTGRRGVFWRINHVGANGGGVLMSNVGSTGTHCIAARGITVPLEAGDSVQLTSFQEQGSALNTVGGTQGPSISISYERPPVSPI
jgi:hypothetical protein